VSLVYLLLDFSVCHQKDPFTFILTMSFKLAVVLRKLFLSVFVFDQTIFVLPFLFLFEHLKRTGEPDIWLVVAKYPALRPVLFAPV